jgi:hypothetical protein
MYFKKRWMQNDDEDRASRKIKTDVHHASVQRKFAIYKLMRKRETLFEANNPSASRNCWFQPFLLSAVSSLIDKTTNNRFPA